MKMLRGFALIVFFALATPLAWADETQVTIIVGGKQVQTSVLQTNGVIYVPLEKIAQVLGVEFSIETNVVRAAQKEEAPAAQAEAPAAKPPAQLSITITPPRPQTPTGIKGRLTYHRNMYQRNEPDPGAQAWLVREALVDEMASAAGGTVDEPIPQKQTGWDVKFSQEYRFPQAVADQDGEFSFQNIPPGDYLLILQSHRANGLAPRDRKAKMRFKKVHVSEGAIADGSFNFGMTAY